MQKNCIHFVASDKPLGTPLHTMKKSDVCQEVSAGHTRHEYTTGYAHDNILNWFGFQWTTI